MIRNKNQARKRRHRRIRARIAGTSERPRLSVFRSNRHVWAQLIDDKIGKTILSSSDKEIAGNKKNQNVNISIGESVGEALAKKAKEKEINTALFDRGGYKYHGLIKAVAEGARKGGLNF